MSTTTPSVSESTGLQTLQQIISFCYEYGFVFPSSEIYGGLAGVYDYGPAGVELKNHIKNYWWKALVHSRQDIVGIDTAILMHPQVWHASGHTQHFFDWFVDHLKTKKRYRLDHLVETRVLQLLQANQNNTAQELQDRFTEALNNEDVDALHKILYEYNIQEPESGDPPDWTRPMKLQLMFSTRAGATTQDQLTVYLRPETAQGIYVNFLNVQRTTRQKIPFGIAQIGKAFRNELIFRQFLIRMREFEQMEMQFFTDPDSAEKWFDYWVKARLKWYTAVGIPENKLRVTPHKHLAHYASKAVDIEYKFPMGWKEVEGIHWRTNYDLSRHQEFSGKKLSYFDPSRQQHYIPHVIETSAGLDRIFLLFLSEFVRKETLEDGSQRIVFKCPKWFAPYQVAVFPLVKRDGLPELARKVFNTLRFSFACFYEEKDSIGKRYRRHDALGTPFAITIDYQSLQDNTVTVRDRDTLQQIRIGISELKDFLKEQFSIEPILKQLYPENP